MKGGTKMTTNFSSAFCIFMTKTCILLFFPVFASKIQRLLIMNTVSKIRKSNPIQREFDSNGAIRTFDHEPPAPKNKLLQTKHDVPSRRRHKPNPKGIFV
jgi:hypothetical protein